MLVGVLTALAAALAFGVAALLQAVAARREPPVRGVDVRLLVRMLRQPAFTGAVALNLVGFALHLAALRALPLFLAQTVVSASVVVTALLAARVLGAPLTRVEHASVLGVFAGLALLTATAAQAGTTAVDVGGRAALLGAAGVVTAAGVGAARLPGPAGASLLGLASGLGFAVVAVAARVLPDLAPGPLLRDPATYALLAGGAVAFLLYATALQRAAVMTVTSAVVLGQTVVPALVGVLLLGDEVRPGSAPLAVVGVALAVTGALALARFDPQVLGAGPRAAG